MARRLSPWGLSLFLLALLAVVLPELCAADDDGSSRQYDGKTGAKKLIAEMKKKGYNTALSLFESTGIAKELPEAMSYYRLTVLAPTDEAFAKLSSSVTKGLSKAAMRDIAMLHIVKGRKDAAMLVRMQREHECMSCPPPLLSLFLPSPLPVAHSKTGEAGPVKPVNSCVTFPLFPSLSLSSPLFPSPLPSSSFSSPLPSQWRTPSKDGEAGLFRPQKRKSIRSTQLSQSSYVFGSLPSLFSPLQWRTPSKNGEAGLFKATETKVKPVKLHAEGGKNVTITKPDSVLLTISAVHGIDKVIIPGSKLTGSKKKLSLKESLDLTNGEEDMDYDN
ncbi:unnamed protein product [Closterium sp. NIES-54]